MDLRVGKIPFLVCAPFFHHFLDENRRFEGISFVDGVPSALNQMLWTGKIHLAPASSIAYAKDPKSLILVPDICTSCNLEVHSVELFSKYPMEKLSKKRIYLTAQSGTSVALLRVLCSQYFQIQPEYVSDLADADAALFIGDEALKRKMQNDWPYCFDLAKLWREWKNLPFVFGAWSVHRSALSAELLPLLKIFLENLRQSIAEFRENPTKAISAWKKIYPIPFSAEQLKFYYDSLDYEFTEERKRSLSLYFNLCVKEGILPEEPRLEFLPKI